MGRREVETTTRLVAGSRPHMSALLAEVRAATATAVRLRFASVACPGVDWERAAGTALRRLTWPWDADEWEAEVERVAREIDLDEEGEWLTDEARARRGGPGG